jgi:hypothetical protein
MELRPSKASEHEANHGQIDHGLPGLSLPFVVAVEPARTSQPAKGAFHNPAPRQDLEGMQLGTFDYLYRAAPPVLRPVQQGSGVATVGPDVSDSPRGLLPEEGRQQLPSRIPVLNVGWQDHHQQHQTHRIDQDMSFAALDLFAGIVTPLVAGFTALDALAVDDRRAGVALATVEQTQMFPQMGVDLLPHTVVLPEPKVMIDCAPGSKVFGQIAPLRASSDDEEHGVEQLPERMLAPPTSLRGLGKTIVDKMPFGVGKIRCVSHRERIADCGTRYKLTLKET